MDEPLADVPVDVELLRLRAVPLRAPLDDERPLADIPRPLLLRVLELRPALDERPLVALRPPPLVPPVLRERPLDALREDRPAAPRPPALRDVEREEPALLFFRSAMSRLSA